MRSRASSPARAWALAMQLAFVAGDLDHAVRIAADALRELDPITVLDQVVTPAMHRVGELWESDMLSVADEHLATGTLHGLLAAVAPLLRTAEPGSRPEVAVLATAPGEGHTAALLMAEAVLRGAGWHVRNVGSGVPAPALRRLIEREQPAVVALSSTMATSGQLDRTIADAHAAAPAARILVGGRSAGRRPAPPAERVTNLRGLVEALELSA